MDHVNKSFSLATSVPAPKYVSGSISIGTGSTQLRRVCNEFEDRKPNQKTFKNTKFLEMGQSGTIKGSSFTTVSISVSVEATELPSYTRASTIPDSGWRSRGVLVVHLQEHHSAVNNIVVSANHSFFVIASEDFAVRVWDSKKLDKDISFRSSLTYSLKGSRALCVAVQGSAHVVVGGCDGTIHIFSTDYISRGLGNVVERYSGIVNIKKYGVGEGAIPTLLNYRPDGGISKMILYSTQNCGIHLWDTRTSSNAWNSKVIPQEGYVSSFVADPCGNWFVSGSSRVLTLWDLRFCIPVNSWQYSLASPIEKMCLFVPPPNTSSAAMRPLFNVAAGRNAVSL